MVIAGRLMGLNDSYNIDMTAGIKPADYSMCSSLNEAACSILYETQVDIDRVMLENFVKETNSNYFKENGVEVLHEGIRSIVDKIIETIKSWLSKILGLIRRAKEAIVQKFARFKNSKTKEKLDQMNGKTDPSKKKRTYEEYKLKAAAFNKSQKEKQEEQPEKKKYDSDKPFFPKDKEFQEENYKEAFKKIDQLKFIYPGIVDFSYFEFNKDVEKLTGLVNQHKDKDGKLPLFAFDMEKKFTGPVVTINEKIYSLDDCNDAVNNFEKVIKKITSEESAAKNISNKIIMDINKWDKEYEGYESKELQDIHAVDHKNIVSIVGDILSINAKILTSKLSILLKYQNQVYKCTNIYFNSNYDKDAYIDAEYKSIKERIDKL